jgi:threonine synthase
MDISCTNCRQPYPPDRLPYLCPTCGGLYDFHNPFLFVPTKIDRFQPGIWRYRHTFGLSTETKPVSLGEGNSPLLWVKVFSRNVAFKCEYLNPSGSFKDRGSALIAAWLHTRGISEAVEDSSGNAGASLAAYAARAGIKTRIFVPELTSTPKYRQIKAYGAELVPVHGSRTDVADAVKVAADGGLVYASHAYLPINLPGYATAAYEIFEQMGNKIPGAVIVPTGQGGLLLGLARGFEALRIAYSKNTNNPVIIGVQARACAPLVAMISTGSAKGQIIEEIPTLAEGVSVRSPLRGMAVIQAIKASHGTVYPVEEKEILPACKALSQLGFYLEPTSAIVWNALEKLIKYLPDPVVVVLTGSGYKYARN